VGILPLEKEKYDRTKDFAELEIRGLSLVVAAAGVPLLVGLNSMRFLGDVDAIWIKALLTVAYGCGLFCLITSFRNLFAKKAVLANWLEGEAGITGERDYRTLYLQTNARHLTSINWIRRCLFVE
jgi:hypothetical protein